MESTKKQRRGMVYTMTNAADNNQVVALRRGVNGRLSRIRAYSTGGNGTGTGEVSPATPQDGVDPLASQGSLLLARDGRHLFAVNAGSNSISSFRVAIDGTLDLVDVEPSGGSQPNSLAVCSGLLYTANVGDAANQYRSNVSGFYIERDGRLTPIPGAVYELSIPNAQPAGLAFSPDGKLLVVSELTTSVLSAFRVNSDGSLAGPIINPSSGSGPFGSVFLERKLLLVSEAGDNALSSYMERAGGVLDVVSPSVPNGQTATCWVAATPGERYAYTSNSGSGTISIYRINEDGSLTYVESATATHEGAAANPIDIGISKDGQNLYALIGNTGWISVFKIKSDGRLIRLQVYKDAGLPRLGSQGLTAR